MTDCFCMCLSYMFRGKKNEKMELEGSKNHLNKF